MNNLNSWKECIQNDTVFDTMYAHFHKYTNREDIGSLDDNEQEKITPEQLKTALLDQLENTLEMQIVHMKNELRQFMDSLDNQRSVIDSLLESFENWDENTSYVSFGQFVKNYLYYICCIVPNYVKEGTKINENKQMKHLLLEEDFIEIKRVISEKYADIFAFEKDVYLVRFMEEVQSCLKPMYDFLTQFYGFFPTNRESLYRRFLLFSLIFVFHYLVQISSTDKTISVIFQNMKENEDNEEYDLDEAEEMQIANLSTVQNRLFEFIQTLLQTRNVFDRDRRTTLFSYESIRRNTERVEAEEKKKMMDRFKNIKDIKTRRAELMLKKYHLGKFYVDPKVIKTYGRRRDKMLDTDDLNEEAFLFGTDETTEDDVQDLIEEMNEDIYMDNEVNPDINWGDSDDEDGPTFLRQMEDDDANDIAENAYDNL